MINLTEILNHAPARNCSCHSVDSKHSNFIETTLGVDPRNGRFADIILLLAFIAGQSGFNILLSLSHSANQGDGIEELLMMQI